MEPNYCISTYVEMIFLFPLSHLSFSALSPSSHLSQCLHDVSVVKGQLVVLECRLRGTPPLQVMWYREEEQIQDSDDFRILRKSKCVILGLNLLFFIKSFPFNMSHSFVFLSLSLKQRIITTLTLCSATILIHQFCPEINNSSDYIRVVFKCEYLASKCKS